jgi:hypothetical protein
MSLIAQAQNDIKQITSNLDEFAVSLKLTNLINEEINIKGLHTKIHLGVDTDGNMVNAKKAHISFSEDNVLALGFSIRNIKGEVDLRKWKVDVKDSTGIVKKYSIQQWFPDETIGLIVCILEDYGTN